MKELRKLMQAESLANHWQYHLCDIGRRIQEEPDPQKMIELAQRFIASYALEKPLLVNELRNELTVIIGQCDMLEDTFATEADPSAPSRLLKQWPYEWRTGFPIKFGQMRLTT